LVVHNEIQADTDVKAGTTSLKLHVHPYTDTPTGASVTSPPQ
jgi:hypothetical protein